MNFLELQEDLSDIIGDRRAEWKTGGPSLKKAINYGIEKTWKRLMNNSHYKDQNFKEAELTAVSGSIDLPTDFGIEYEMEYGKEEFYDYRIDKKNKKIVFDDTSFSGTVTFRYMEKYSILSDDTDETIIEEHFHEAIPLYGMERYHRSQLDWTNASQSVAYADDMIEDLITKYF